ncbi:DUF732 domain-containing protein [Mycolicibacterium sp. jd]|uniref:DUF732 domain-containing protein n=1 Tax=unclassified Mycolicibacterium TaxID=2636767 RepID=UPI00351B829E
MRAKLIVSAAVAAAGLATALAAPAFADETDDIFISALQNQGIPFSTAKNAIELASAVCDYAAAGQDPTQIALEIMEPAGWTAEQSGFFVGAATQSYCPS